MSDQAAVIRHFARAINFEQYCRDLASAGVFKWIVDLEEETRHYWSKDNTLLYKECLMPLNRSQGEAARVSL